MSAVVVNVRVKYLRDKTQNENWVCEECDKPTLKNWMSDDNNVYIGRKNIVIIDKRRYPEKDSLFQNPFKVGKDGTLDEVLEKYEGYLKVKLEDEEFREELLKLKGKRLGCWCKPERCHGDILLKYLNEELNKDD
jgi:hypothetical protein